MPPAAPDREDEYCQISPYGLLYDVGIAAVARICPPPDDGTQNPQALPVKVEEPASVRMIILKLLKKFSEEFKQVLIDSQLDNPIPNALILVGGKEISSLQGLETTVRDTEEIVLLPIAHGG